MAPEEKIKTTIEIFGTTYRMVGTYSQSYMNQIAAYVNENMETIAKGNPRLDTMKVAVLALVAMADEYFQLRAKWDSIEQERTQSKRHMEELRKAFELTEEKERGKTNEVRLLQERIERLEKENVRIAEETELASLSWAERVEEWEAKYANAVRESESTIAALQARVNELEAERDSQASLVAELQREVAAASSPAADAPVPAASPSAPADPHASAPAVPGSFDPTLLEKYEKLKEEYAKLQNEFNEWIQLTQSETQ